MFATIAVILLILWALGLVTHILGTAIYIFLVLAIISGIAHFLQRKNGPST